jgi:RNA polymerase sigma factor (sigma-70 family)
MTNNELIDGCINNDNKIQELFYKKFYLLVKTAIGKNICLNRESTFDVNDLIQLTFIKIFKQIKTYSKTTLLNNWIYTIAKNTAIDYYRSNLNHNSKYTFIDVVDYENIIDNTYDYDYDLKQKINKEKIIKCLNDLSPRYREIVELYVFDNLTHDEIAKVLNINVGTSKSNYHKAKNNIKILLNKKEHI